MDMTSTAEAAARSWYDNPRLGGSPQTNGLGSAGSGLVGHHSLTGGASLGGSAAGLGSGSGGGGGGGLGLDSTDMSAFYALESNGHHRRYYSSYHQHTSRMASSHTSPQVCRPHFHPPLSSWLTSEHKSFAPASPWGSPFACPQDPQVDHKVGQIGQSHQTTTGQHSFPFPPTPPKDSTPDSVQTGPSEYQAVVNAFMHQAQVSGATSLSDASCALDIKPTIQNGSSGSHNGSQQSSAPKQREGTNNTNNNNNNNTTNNHNAQNNNNNAGNTNSALNGSGGLFDNTAQAHYANSLGNLGGCAGVSGVAGSTGSSSTGGGYDGSYASYAVHHHASAAAAHHQAAAAAAAGMFQSSSAAAAAAVRHSMSGGGHHGHHGVGSSGGLGGIGGNSQNSVVDVKPARTKPRTSAGKQDKI
ncbi:GATA-binding factor C-like [Teleopsis dalmanni]|uniref:GATA-binding factor C-like n=1 Tax=Teleopsis dalmanni TaxID=139649 RepID=UPI0018CEF61F|nr:GATA-binding factor C-like [Teleopsis dalmanni]